MATFNGHVVRVDEKEFAWHGAHWFIGFRFVILFLSFFDCNTPNSLVAVST
jgi:hypothetical protein